MKSGQSNRVRVRVFVTVRLRVRVSVRFRVSVVVVVVVSDQVRVSYDFPVYDCPDTIRIPFHLTAVP